MSTESVKEASYARLTDLQIAEQLVEQAKDDGVELVGPGGAGWLDQDGPGDRS